MLRKIFFKILSGCSLKVTSVETQILSVRSIEKQGRLVAKVNGGAASENHPIGLIFVTIYQLYTHTLTHTNTQLAS